MGDRASWLFFDYAGRSPSGKTTIHTVKSSYDLSLLGSIKWFGRWRKYAFYPEPGALFEEDCLREIAEFCEAATAEHRARKRVEAV